MSTDNLVTAEQLAGALAMAVEGIKKKPGLMKSAVPHMELIHKYVENIATAKDKGKWVIAHGTQQPLEIFEAMDCVSLFNEFWGVISDVVKIESVPEALSISNSIGTAQEVCSFFKNMDGLMDAGKWPKTDLLLYATSSCDNVKAFHTLGRRYGIPSFGMERPDHPWSPQAMELLEERAQAADRLPGGAHGQEDGLRPSEGDGAPLLPSHRAHPRDRGARSAHVPSPMSAECFGRHAAGGAPVCRDPVRRGLPGSGEGGAPGAGGQRHRRRQPGALPDHVERLHPVLGSDAPGLHAAEVRGSLGVRGAVAAGAGMRNG